MSDGASFERAGSTASSQVSPVETLTEQLLRTMRQSSPCAQRPWNLSLVNICPSSTGDCIEGDTVISALGFFYMAMNEKESSDERKWIHPAMGECVSPQGKAALLSTIGILEKTF